MIKKVLIKNFIGHDELVIDQFAPITVIIGENDTGKTGIMKMIYATLKSLEKYSLMQNSYRTAFKTVLADKIFDTFQPRKSAIGELVSKSSKEKLSVDIRIDRKDYSQDIYFSFGENTTKSIIDCSEQITTVPNDFNTLFVPSKEVLTALHAIKFTRKPNYYFGFDDTYLDLIEALEIPTQKGNINTDLSKVNKDLEKLFDGVVNQSDKDEPFVFKKGNTEFSMSLTSEGVKKIGILTTLIRNRQLGKNTILFFDEVETALHPKAIRQIVEMIVGMSKAGVQVILSTHNYFVIKQFMICAKRDNLDINCLSLTKDGKKIGSQISNLRDGLPDNPIVNEALKMFDEEVELDFQK
jgi:AAA15 family ATPase/GTPase